MNDIKSFTNQPLRGSMLAFVLSTILLLLLALVAKIFVLSEDMLPIINQVCKAIAVVVACVVVVKDDRLLPKAGILALMYSILNCILYVCLGGQFSFITVALDFGIALVVAVVVCLLKARKR